MLRWVVPVCGGAAVVVAVLAVIVIRSGEPEGEAAPTEAAATLPGGFRYETGTLTEYHTGSARPCADGRNAAPPVRLP